MIPFAFVWPADCGPRSHSRRVFLEPDADAAARAAERFTKRLQADGHTAARVTFERVPPLKKGEP